MLHGASKDLPEMPPQSTLSRRGDYSVAQRFYGPASVGAKMAAFSWTVAKIDVLQVWRRKSCRYGEQRTISIPVWRHPTTSLRPATPARHACLPVPCPCSTIRILQHVTHVPCEPHDQVEPSEIEGDVVHNGQRYTMLNIAGTLSNTLPIIQSLSIITKPTIQDATSNVQLVTCNMLHLTFTCTTLQQCCMQN